MDLQETELSLNFKYKEWYNRHDISHIMTIIESIKKDPRYPRISRFYKDREMVVYKNSVKIFGVEYYYDFGIGIPVNKYESFTFDNIIAHGIGLDEDIVYKLRDKFIAARHSSRNDNHDNEIQSIEIDGIVVVWESRHVIREIYPKHLPEIRVEPHKIATRPLTSSSSRQCSLSIALYDLFTILGRKYLTPYADEVATIKYITEALPQPIAEEIVGCLDAIIERRFIRHQHRIFSHISIAWNSDKAKRCEVLYTIIERYGKKYACPFAPMNLGLSWEDAAAETYAYVRDKMPNWREG